MVIFHSYVSLPEGNNNNIIVFHVGNHYPPVILLWQWTMLFHRFRSSGDEDENRRLPFEDWNCKPADFGHVIYVLLYFILYIYLYISIYHTKIVILYVNICLYNICITYYIYIMHVNINRHIYVSIECVLGHYWNRRCSIIFKRFESWGRHHWISGQPQKSEIETQPDGVGRCCCWIHSTHL